MSKQKKTMGTSQRMHASSHVSLSASQKKNSEHHTGLHFGFHSNNYRLLLIGLGINVLGFLLMIGGGTNDPNVFNEVALFSSIRITISPMLIIGGYVVILFAIMKRKPKGESTETVQE